MPDGRPRAFAPIERSVDTVDWSAWLGFNTSHGLGIFTFGLLCLLIATDDFILVERIDAIRPLTIALSAAYIGLSLRFCSTDQGSSPPPQCASPSPPCSRLERASPLGNHRSQGITPPAPRLYGSSACVASASSSWKRQTSNHRRAMAASKRRPLRM
jgi:hypothetical protein